MKRNMIFLIVLTLLLGVGCSSQAPIKPDDVNENGKIVVYASFYPMYYAASEVGKDNVDLRLVIPNGVEPHDFEPTPKQVAEIEEADIFIYNGANMEPWADKLAENLRDRDVEIINASNYIELLHVDEFDSDHVHEGESDEDIDPHIWLDPMNMKRISMAFKSVLVSRDSENANYYEENYETLANRLDDLDKKYVDELNNRKTNTILVSHSAFGYLAHRYEIEQVSVAGISPHSEPSPKKLAELTDLAREKNFKYIFFEVLANSRTAETLANEADLDILILNPVSGLTEKEQQEGKDYLSIMEENLINLKKALVD